MPSPAGAVASTVGVPSAARQNRVAPSEYVTEHVGPAGAGSGVLVAVASGAAVGGSVVTGVSVVSVGTSAVGDRAVSVAATTVSTSPGAVVAGWPGSAEQARAARERARRMMDNRCIGTSSENYPRSRQEREERTIKLFFTR